MTTIQCFPPIESPRAKVLILGSMPGKASLQASQYYAHPRNAFWPIMGELMGVAPNLPYATRIEILQSAGIALWDVLASCLRDGSLDAGIVEASIAVNDFKTFFLTHPGIADVFFNGGTAERYFIKYALPLLEPNGLRFHRLPSTSPAHAAKTFQQKLADWGAVVQL